MSQEYGYIAVRETIARARNEAVSSLKPKSVTEQVSRTEATQLNTTEMKRTDLIGDVKELKAPLKDAQAEVKNEAAKQEETDSKESASEVVVTEDSVKPEKYNKFLIGGGILLALIGGYLAYKKFKK